MKAEPSCTFADDLLSVMQRSKKFTLLFYTKGVRHIQGLTEVCWKGERLLFVSLLAVAPHIKHPEIAHTARGLLLKQITGFLTIFPCITDLPFIIVCSIHIQMHIHQSSEQLPLRPMAPGPLAGGTCFWLCALDVCRNDEGTGNTSS